MRCNTRICRESPSIHVGGVRRYIVTDVLTSDADGPGQCALCSGKGLPIAVLELFDRDMRISLRGLQRGMAEHLLHLAQIRTPVEHMGGGGMAQRMRRDVRHPRLLGLLMHHLTHHTLVDAAPTYTNEHRVAAVPIREYPAFPRAASAQLPVVPEPRTG